MQRHPMAVLSVFAAVMLLGLASALGVHYSHKDGSTATPTRKRQIDRPANRTTATTSSSIVEDFSDISEDEHRELLQAALDRKPCRVPPDVRQFIKATLLKIERGGWQVNAVFDVDELSRIVNVNEYGMRLKESERRVVIDRAENLIVEMPTHGFFESSFHAVEIIAAKEIDGTDRIVLITKSKDSEHSQECSMYRWWLVREFGKWRIYDFEVLKWNRRLSTVFKQWWKQCGNRNDLNDEMFALWKKFRTRIDEIYRTSAQNGDEQFGSEFDRLIPQFAAEAKIWRVQFDFSRRNLPAARTTLEHSEAQCGSIPNYWEWAAIIAAEEERWDDCIACGAKYCRMGIPNAVVLDRYARALGKRNRSDDAIKVCHRSIKFEPKSQSAILTLIESLPANRKSELIPYIKAHPNPPLIAGSAFNSRLYAGDVEACRVILGSGVVKEESTRLVMECSIAIMERDLPAWHRTYAALRKLPPKGRWQEGRSTVAFRILERGLEVEFLTATSPELRPILFFDLFDDFETDDEAPFGLDSERFETLLTAFAKLHPNDPMIDVARGGIAVEIGDRKAAENHFASAMAGDVRAAEIRDRILDRRTANLLGDFDVAVTYRKLGQTKEAFAAVTDAPSEVPLPILRELLKEHKSKHPDDPLLLYWGATADFRDHKYDSAVDQFQKFRAVPELPDRFYLLNRNIVLCLIKLGRYVQAEREIENLGKEDRFQYVAKPLSILLAISRKDFRSARNQIMAIEEFEIKNVQWQLHSLPELSQALQHPDLRDILERYPAPKPYQPSKDDPDSP